MRDRKRTVLFSILAIAVLGACGAPQEEPAAVEPAEAEAAPASDLYDLRGEVTEMPAEADGKMYIRHEAIPDFKGADGEVQGMDSMIMGFTPAEDVSLDGVDIGTKIAFVVEMSWGDAPGMTIREVEILAPETELDVAY